MPGPVDGPRQTLHETTYRRLRDGLMQGALVPGQTLTVRSLTEIIGTSPMPVREALRRLASERAVEVMGNGRLRVRLLDGTQGRQLMEIRATLGGVRRGRRRWRTRRCSSRSIAPPAMPS